MPDFIDLAPVEQEAEVDPEDVCDNCGAVVARDTLCHNERLGLAVCETCDLDHPTLYECDHCGREFEDEDEAYDCCRYTCPSCGSVHRYPEDADGCCPQHECPSCYSLFYSEDEAMACCRRGSSSYPALEALDAPYLVSVPEIEGRPGRVCSIEQEINDGGSEATRMLYDFGFADSEQQVSYSSSGRPGRVSVKGDASLTGDDPAEIVYSRFRLWEPHSTRDLSLALGRMRQLARETTPGVVRVNKSAGTHIHISATAENGLRIGPTEMGALHEIFAYSEDFLYSLAAAGWDAHRASPHSSGYCKPIPKLAVGQKATGFRVHALMRGDRYFGLNFQRLLDAAGSCSCGAGRYGEWQECECGAFDSATVEWRLFNASTKPETLHAWLLLAHSLTAMSFGHPVGTLPTNSYGSQDAEGRRSVQTWIETNAPLTDDEILVIRRAAAKSPGLGKPRR